MADDAIIDDLKWRGFLYQSTDEERIRARLRSGQTPVYCGFDPTAPSLQVGNLVPLFGLARFQRAGHAPIALLGGGTGLIGDPRDTSERALRSTDVVREWADRIRPQLERFLDFDPKLPNAAILLDNYEWLGPMTATELLRDVGKHFPIGYMLAKETVRSRLESGISYTEFSYMLLQAYDYLELSRRLDCRLQIGGSDQWGNITAGCELIRRVDGGEADAITFPLVTKADGEKFGKSESGAVYLDPELTHSFTFFQFWLNQDDADAGRFLRVFSFRVATRRSRRSTPPPRAPARARRAARAGARPDGARPRRGRLGARHAHVRGPVRARPAGGGRPGRARARAVRRAHRRAGRGRRAAHLRRAVPARRPGREHLRGRPPGGRRRALRQRRQGRRSAECLHPTTFWAAACWSSRRGAGTVRWCGEAAG